MLLRAPETAEHRLEVSEPSGFVLSSQWSSTALVVRNFLPVFSLHLQPGGLHPCVHTPAVPFDSNPFFLILFFHS